MMMSADSSKNYIYKTAARHGCVIETYEYLDKDGVTKKFGWRMIKKSEEGRAQSTFSFLKPKTILLTVEKSVSEGEGSAKGKEPASEEATKAKEAAARRSAKEKFRSALKSWAKTEKAKELRIADEEYEAPGRSHRVITTRSLGSMDSNTPIE